MSCISVRTVCLTPLEKLEFLTMQDVVGIQCGARGWSLALQLFVSGSLLATLRLYRFGFAVGVLRVSFSNFEAIMPLSRSASFGKEGLISLWWPVCGNKPAVGMALNNEEGKMQAQHEAESIQRALRAQRGACALVQRAIILHGSKLVALAAFGAAMQAPGACGWILICALQPQLTPNHTATFCTRL